MKRIFIFFFIVAPIIVFGQSVKNGVAFEAGLDWQQVLKKAKANNKYVFAVCMRSNSKDIKFMETEVFASKPLGELINGDFIAVEIKLDTAQKLTERYILDSDPNYLFIAPSGKLIHQALGRININDFVTMVHKVIDPVRTNRALLQRYNQGKLDFASMPELALAVNAQGDKQLYRTIINDYVKNYLYKLPDSSFLRRDRIKVFASNAYFLVQRPEDEGFEVYYHRGRIVDSLFERKGFSASVVERAIIDGVITPIISHATATPDWDAIFSVVASKYGNAIANNTVYESKYRWYYHRKDWVNTAKAYLEKIDKCGRDAVGTDGVVNNVVYQVFFEHVEDKDLLSKGLKLQEMLIKSSSKKHEEEEAATKSYYADTYANMLYKLGRINEAIVLEQQILAKTPSNDEYYKNYSSAYEKMKRGEPTWNIQ